MSDENPEQTLRDLQRQREAIQQSRAALQASGVVNAELLALLGAQANQIEQKIHAVQGGNVVGNIQVMDGNVIIADTVIIADRLLHSWKQPAKTTDLKGAMVDYLNYLQDRHRYLSLKGMGVAERIPLRLPLLDLYVPLKARREVPEGETWSGEARLAGRALAQGTEGGPRLSEPQPLIDLLQQNDGLIILGDPGAGKTTFMKFLALKLASGAGGEMGLGERLPILLPLAAYAVALQEGQGQARLDDFIARYTYDGGSDLPMGQMLAEALRQGSALILLDGLDEVHQPGLRHSVVERVVDFYTFHRRAGNKFVLTSRIVGYHEVQPTADGLVECTLTDFTDDDIEEFVQRWTSAIETQAQGDTGVARADAQVERNELLRGIKENQGVRRLAANPLLLTILALMKRQGVTLPERRVELYNKYVETLLTVWNRARSLLGSGPGRDIDWIQTERMLAELALWMHSASSGAGLVPAEALRRELVRLYTEKGEGNPEGAARLFLEDVHDITSLLLERGAGQYGFIHLTFEEYLAAGGAALHGKGAAEPVLDLLSQHIGQQEWHEVSLLAIGYLGIRQQLPDVAGQVIEGLVERHPGQPGEAVVLAGEAVCDAWPGGVPLQSRERVVTALVETVKDETIPARLRFTAGELLGRLGDPRPGVCQPLTPEIPRLDWAPIPAGPFRMGSPEELKNAYSTERPQHTLDLPAFYLSRYLVTNAQYRPFVDGGGYQERHYWSEHGWEWRNGKDSGLVAAIQNKDLRSNYQNWLSQRPVGRRDRPFYWNDPQLSASNRPVVGVSWYEAQAFCRWLEEQLSAVSGQLSVMEGLGQAEQTVFQGLAQGKLRLGLPSEAEWEKAARGPLPSPSGRGAGGEGNRAYPWGDQPDPERANTKEAGLGSASAVGVFPAGAFSYGVHDLIGNVWEWTRSRWGGKWETPEFRYPYDPADGREDLASLDFRVLRGGSWYNEQSVARCGCRNRFIPDLDDGCFGFRLAASLVGSES